MDERGGEGGEGRGGKRRGEGGEGRGGGLSGNVAEEAFCLKSTTASAEITIMMDLGGGKKYDVTVVISSGASV